MRTKERFREFTSKLIAQGESVLGTQWQPAGNWVSGPPSFVDLHPFSKWRASCKLLVSMMGDIAEPWKDIFINESNNKLEVAIMMQGTLEAIRDAIDDDLLIRFEELVFAEAFSNLMEQGKYLVDQGYILAGGVVFRSVLEESLRQLCARHGCLPQKQRPTVSDYNNELYKTKVYDKIMFKHIDAMAAIGNDAAHNNTNLDRKDVERFKQDLGSFIHRFATLGS